MPKELYDLSLISSEKLLSDSACEMESADTNNRHCIFITNTRCIHIYTSPNNPSFLYLPFETQQKWIPYHLSWLFPF
jgi:hypothetical protein